MDKELNLWEKIVKLRTGIDVLKKDGDGYGYKYVTGNQILLQIKDDMNTLGLILQPSTQSGQWETHNYVTNKGKDAIDFIVNGQGSYTWINSSKPEEREKIDFAYYGQQGDISQAFGSALTYSERYFLLKYFGLPTDEDDPDSRPNNNYTKNQTKIEWTKETKFTFGKYNGKTVTEVYGENPSYFKYLSENSSDLGLKAFSVELYKYYEEHK